MWLQCASRTVLGLVIGTVLLLTVAVETAHSMSIISEQQLNRILDVIAASWTEKTKETYGAGLLVFHVYCDIQYIILPKH